MNPYFSATNWTIDVHSNPDHKLHLHAHHELFYCLGGAGMHHWHGGAPFGVRRGTLALFPAGMAHNSVCAPGQSFDCSVISFHSALFGGMDDADRTAAKLIVRLSKVARAQPELELRGKPRQRCAALFGGLIQEFITRPTGYQLRLKAQLGDLLVEIARGLPGFEAGSAAPASEVQSYVQDICYYIDAHYMEPLRVDDFLSWVPFSRSRLHAHFKRITGQTLVERITAVRIRHAMELLVETDRSVTDIALCSGFNTLGNFYRAFKSATGSHPRALREGARDRRSAGGA